MDDETGPDVSGVRGIIFDKDGTLFDFQSSWAAWAERLLDDLSEGDSGRRGILAEAMGFDTGAHRFRPDSFVIAGTPGELGDVLLPHLPGHDPAGLIAHMNALSAEARMIEAVPLRPLFDDLRARGLRLGVATNDAEASARTHLARVEILDLVEVVAGFDSGHGAKPEAGMLLACAAAFALAPREVLMVGDSRHDLAAGRAAGMMTMGVLTGPATADDLAPLADIVVPDIGHLPALLDRCGVAKTTS